MRGVMIVGTASNVGKSIITTAICRIFVNEGYVVAPFKSQNMSHKIHFIKDDMKIALSQAIQAQAAKVEPTVWMNPIVLNAKSETTSEVILLGKTVEQMSGKKYRDVFYEKGLAAIKQSLEMLQNEFDVIVMEGAGSPVELNLKDRELVNMKIADLADVPVLLVADIDRGGVFASIIGTLELLTPLERERVQGIIINKFRGDPSLFHDGIRWIEEHTNIPVLGLIPYIEHQIPAEDSLSEMNRFEKNVELDNKEDYYEDLAVKIQKHLDWQQIINIMNRWVKK